MIDRTPRQTLWWDGWRRGGGECRGGAEGKVEDSASKGFRNSHLLLGVEGVSYRSGLRLVFSGSVAQ